MIRSNGFNSTLNGIVVVFPERREAQPGIPDMAPSARSDRLSIFQITRRRRRGLPRRLDLSGRQP
jgi:hypothetical protein